MKTEAIETVSKVERFENTVIVLKCSTGFWCGQVGTEAFENGVIFISVLGRFLMWYLYTPI